MWNEKVIKIIPSLLFLFCLLQIFELVLVASVMEKTEKLEIGIKTNLEILENITEDLTHLKDKEIKIK